mgnify:CR=1 FL=1
MASERISPPANAAVPLPAARRQKNPFIFLSFPPEGRKGKAESWRVERKWQDAPGKIPGKSTRRRAGTMDGKPPLLPAVLIWDCPASHKSVTNYIQILLHANLISGSPIPVQSLLSYIFYIPYFYGPSFFIPRFPISLSSFPSVKGKSKRAEA